MTSRFGPSISLREPELTGHKLVATSRFHEFTKEKTVTKSIPTNKARQGRLGWQVLIVLIASLLLVFAVWGGVHIYGEIVDNTATQSLKG